jgi:hypothetical protein
VAELFQTFIELITVFLRLVVEVLALGLTWSFLLFWFAWWLWAVNWKKAWHVLGEGGWAPVALVCLMVAGVWSQLRPVRCRSCLAWYSPTFGGNWEPWA